ANPDNTTERLRIASNGNITVTGTLIGNGSGLTSLNGSNISSGTVANARLVNSGALTVTAGNGLTGGGSVALGGSTSLAVGAGSGITVGATTVSITTDGVTDSHLQFNTGQHLTTSSSPTFGGLVLGSSQLVLSPNTDLSALNPGVSATGASIAGPVNAHMVFDIKNNDARDAFAIRYSAANNTTVDTIGLVFNANGRLGIGTSNPSSAIDVIGSGEFSSSVTAASFSGSGSGLTSLNGSNISTGTVANARLTGSGALTVSAGNGLTGGGSVALGGSTSLAVGAGSGITVGSTTVSVTTDGISDTHLQFNTGQHLTTSSSPTFNTLTISGSDRKSAV